MESQATKDIKGENVASGNNSLTALNGSLTSFIGGLNNQSTEKLLSNPDYGNAAFSLASLDQPSKGSFNLSIGNFDTSAFLNKSGSFESLHGMLNVSSLFKQGGFAADFMSNHNASNANDTPIKGNMTVTAVPSSPVAMQQMNPNINKSIVPTTPQPQSILMNAVSPNANGLQPYGNNALIQPKENEKRIIERKDENSKFVDVTPFLTLPQHEAAKKLGIPSSTLAKRWKEASCNRKWPYRTVSKLDKEILTLLKNVENAKAELSPSVEANLGMLLKRRQEELKTVLVRL